MIAKPVRAFMYAIIKMPKVTQQPSNMLLTDPIWHLSKIINNLCTTIYIVTTYYKETADFWCKNKKRNLRIYEGGILNNIHETKMYFKMSNILSIKTASCLQNGGGINELKRRLKLICFSRTTPFNYCYPPTHVSPLITNRPVNL